VIGGLVGIEFEVRDHWQPFIEAYHDFVAPRQHRARADVRARAEGILLD